VIFEIAPNRFRQGETNLAELPQQGVLALGRFGLGRGFGLRSAFSLGPELEFSFTRRFGHHRFLVELLAPALTYSKRRKRSADQSSSIATMRTDSKPAARMTFHPESRLNSQL